jgi:hypothetical protein
MSAFGCKADMNFCGNPLSRSLLGAKRTRSDLIALANRAKCLMVSHPRQIRFFTNPRRRNALPWACRRGENGQPRPEGPIGIGDTFVLAQVLHPRSDQAQKLRREPNGNQLRQPIWKSSDPIAGGTPMTLRSPSIVRKTGLILSAMWLNTMPVGSAVRLTQ